MQSPASFILMFLVLPVWVAAGFADWVCHRRTHIAQTSGLKENLMHWLMYAEVGVGMIAVALFEINATVLLIVVLVFVAHQLTVFADLDYSTLLRDVGPFEQMVHSFLELLPLVSLALLAMMDWPQAQALFGRGQDLADWTLRPKEDPWPASYLMGAVAATIVFNVLPLLQETWSCVRASTRPPAEEPGPPRRVEPKFDPEPKVRTPANPGPR